MKCLISAMRIAERDSCPFILCWEKNNSVDCRFSDLFENKIAEIDPKELQALIGHKNSDKEYQIVGGWRLETFPEDHIPKNFSKNFPSDSGMNIDLEYERISLHARNIFLPYINRFIIKREIMEQADNISKYFNDDTVAIQIRTWWDDPKRAALLSLRNVYKSIDKISRSNIFVSCDSQEVLKKIIERYGNRILYYNGRNIKDQSNRDTVQDMVNLILLSKAKVLIASWLSTFSELAWWFGGCEAKVEIIPPKIHLFKTAEVDGHVGLSLFWRWHLVRLSGISCRLYELYKSVGQRK